MTGMNECQKELIEVLLNDQAFYPWNPSDPEAEYYFCQQQEHCSFADSLNSDELLNIDHVLYSQNGHQP